MIQRPLKGSLGRLALASTAMWLSSGCETLFLDREPEVAHLELSSTDVSEITRVTSQWFVEVADQASKNGGLDGLRGLVGGY